MHPSRVLRSLRSVQHLRRAVKERTTDLMSQRELVRISPSNVLLPYVSLSSQMSRPHPAFTVPQGAGPHNALCRPMCCAHADELACSRRSAAAQLFCGAALSAFAMLPASPGAAALIDEDAADRVFKSAASSVVSVADFRTESDGSETQEV